MSPSEIFRIEKFITFFQLTTITPYKSKGARDGNETLIRHF